MSVYMLLAFVLALILALYCVQWAHAEQRKRSEVQAELEALQRGTGRHALDNLTESIALALWAERNPEADFRHYGVSEFATAHEIVRAWEADQ